MTLETISRAFELPAAERVTAELEQGFTLPVELYVDPAVHRLEQERIFARSWQYASHVSKLERPGDHVVTQAGDIPIIVTRTKEGELQGFVNACRHRLHPLATENGNCSLLQCPYHGWTYELDGRLRSAPRSQREASFDTSAITLVPVSVDTWDQWVFVNPDPDAAPLADLTHEISQYTADLNRDLSEYEFRVRYEYLMDCNWKIWAENAIECYHCPTLHRASFGKSYDSRPEHYVIQSWSDTIWNSAPIKWLPKDVDPASLKGFRFAFLWPTSFFAVDDYIGFIGSVIPQGPERCRAFVDMYVPPGRDEEISEEWLKMWDLTLEEDKQATDRQQIGYRSGSVPHGRLLLDSESCLQAFMRRTWQALAE